MNSSRQALQTNRVFQILESFLELTTIFEIIVALGCCMRGGRGICADQHTFQFLVFGH